MLNNLKYIFLAIFSGTLLTIMLQANGLLAKHTSPMIASWIAHGIGMISVVIIMLIFYQRQIFRSQTKDKASLIYYFGGIPGAFTIILASIALNGGMSLSTVIALGLVGQVTFSICSDKFGFFGSNKRRITFIDICAVVLVLSGSLLIIFDLRK